MFDVAIKEGTKEAFRIVAIAIIPILLSSLEQFQNGMVIDWKQVGIGILVTALIALIKGVDRGMHEDNTIKKDGLLPF